MIEIRLKVKYLVGGQWQKGKTSPSGTSGKKRSKGVLVPVGIRKRPKKAKVRRHHK